MDVTGGMIPVDPGHDSVWIPRVPMPVPDLPIEPESPAPSPKLKYSSGHGASFRCSLVY